MFSFWEKKMYAHATSMPDFFKTPYGILNDPCRLWQSGKPLKNAILAGVTALHALP
jgi:hypothetical protein